MIKILKEVNSREEYILITKIAKRAEDLGITRGTRITLNMDLEFAADAFNLRLQDLLDADDGNFSHDIIGIQRNINRVTREFENDFVPRYSGNDNGTVKENNSQDNLENINNINTGDLIKIKPGFENSRDEIGKVFRVSSKRGNTLYVKSYNMDIKAPIFPIGIEHVIKVKGD